MNKKHLLIPGIITIALMVMISGCTGGNVSTNPTTPASSTPAATVQVSTAASPAASNQITVTETDSRITITGGKCDFAKSESFKVNTNDKYLVKTTGITTPPQMTIDNVNSLLLPASTSGTAAGYIGSLLSGSEAVVEVSADGPWTIEILKSPKLSPISTDARFSGKDDNITPYFHLNRGYTTFTVDLKSDTKPATVYVDLYNADTGKYEYEIECNSPPGQKTEKVGIPADGNYIISVIGTGTWDISYTQ